MLYIALDAQIKLKTTKPAKVSFVNMKKQGLFACMADSGTTGQQTITAA